MNNIFIFKTICVTLYFRNTNEISNPIALLQKCTHKSILIIRKKFENLQKVCIECHSDDARIFEEANTIIASAVCSSSTLLFNSLKDCGGPLVCTDSLASYFRVGGRLMLR